MTDDTDRPFAGAEYVLFGDHAENLTVGRNIAPGDTVDGEDLREGDRWLIDEGRLRDAAELQPTRAEVDAYKTSPTVLKGDALQQRAAELDIAGRSDMTADELRAAISQAESNTTPEA